MRGNRRRTKILYEIECEGSRCIENASSAFLFAPTSHSISYNIFVLLFVDSRWNQLFNLWERGGDRRFILPQKTKTIDFWETPYFFHTKSWFHLAPKNRKAEIWYRIKCDVGASKNANQAFSTPRLSSQFILYQISAFRFFNPSNQDLEISKILYLENPSGLSTWTVSPTLAPIRAFPNGDSLEISPLRISDSVEPTMRYSNSSSNSSS